MRDVECTELLQWMLPILGLRWPGFRRVRKQVCKRISRRMRELELASAGDYREYLTANEDEWVVADRLCRITISRFYRGKGVFAFLGDEILPTLGRNAHESGRQEISAWSAGCGSGEEPYTLTLLWELRRPDDLADLELRILGTDVDETILRRAQAATYPHGCLKDLPADWLQVAFEQIEAGYQLKPSYRQGVRFQAHDVRTEPMPGPFDLVLCRNLAFTYFDRELQVATAARLGRSLRAGGALVLGSHETLPAEAFGYTTWSEKHKVYRKNP